MVMKKPMHLPGRGLIWGAMAAIGLIPLVAAGQLTCDTTLQPIDNFLMGYKARVNRCEGFFQPATLAEVPALQLVGLTLGEFRFQADIMEVVQVQVPPGWPAGIPLAVRAEGVLPDLYYRLDATIAATQVLDWPVRFVLLPDPRTRLNRNVALRGQTNDPSGQVIAVPVQTRSRLSLPDGNAQVLVKCRARQSLGALEWRWAGESSYRPWTAPAQPTHLAGFRVVPPADHQPGQVHTLEVRFRRLGAEEWQTQAWAIWMP